MFVRSSLRAQRSNPDYLRGKLDCFVAALLAMTKRVASSARFLLRTFTIDLPTEWDSLSLLLSQIQKYRRIVVV
jgi:hypothetical protein